MTILSFVGCIWQAAVGKCCEKAGLQIERHRERNRDIESEEAQDRRFRL